MTTRWSVVLSAGEEGPDSRNALEELCQAYWYPLYRFVRTKGFESDQAADITQGFFALLLERHDFENLKQEKGRFRSFLLASIKNYIANEREKMSAQKRGGAVKTFSIDVDDAEKKFQLDSGDDTSPDNAYERTWALTLLQQVQVKLKQEYSSNEKQKLFEKIASFLGGSSPDLPTYQQVAQELEMTESAVKVNVHRMRKQFRKLLRDEISNTVATEQEIDQELNEMFSVLSQ